jgi:hypothetical protein
MTLAVAVSAHWLVKGETVPESESDVSNEAESAGSPAKEVANEESNVAEEEAVEVEN